jgi:hypothetical protein
MLQQLLPGVHALRTQLKHGRRTLVAAESRLSRPPTIEAHHLGVRPIAELRAALGKLAATL